MHIREINSMDLKSMLKGLTGLDFSHYQDGPMNATFTLHANLNRLSQPTLEWVSRTNSGLLLITSPITKFTFWSLPEDVDLGYIGVQEAEEQLKKDYEMFLESIEQAAYVASEEFKINIKMEKSNEPKFYVFLDSRKTEDDLINVINCFDNLLPQLMLTA